MGYSPAEIIGQSGDIIFIPEDVEKGAPQAEANAVREHGRAEDERWHLRKDGTRFWASGVVTPLHDDAGRGRAAVGLGRERRPDARATAQAERLWAPAH